MLWVGDPTICRPDEAWRAEVALSGGGLFLDSQPVDAEFDSVTGFEVLWRLESQTDPSWSAGGNHIAGQERHELADVAHEEGDFKNEICGGAVLFGFPVDLEPETQSVWVGNFVCGGQPRTQRGEGVGAFAFDPLAAALELPGAFAVVVVEEERRCNPSDSKKASLKSGVQAETSMEVPLERRTPGFSEPWVPNLMSFMVC